MNNQVNILLVEDDEIDALAVERALKREGLKDQLFVARDGLEALDMLRGENSKLKIAEPLIIFLDLNMPRMNGLEFLNEIRSDERLRKLVVFVLTTSNSDDDKTKAYNKNIAGYLLKSKVGEGHSNIIKLINYYFTNMEFPT